MLGEINKDFYCYEDHHNNGRCNNCEGQPVCVKSCGNRRYKYPTPEQFKDEYNREYPDDGAVWTMIITGDGEPRWFLQEYKLARGKAGGFRKHFPEYHIVCACTPWGKPPADWRPE